MANMGNDLPAITHMAIHSDWEDQVPGRLSGSHRFPSVLLFVLVLDFGGS